MPPEAPKELVEMFEKVQGQDFDLETYRPDIRMRGWTDDEITVAYNAVFFSDDLSTLEPSLSSNAPAPSTPTPSPAPIQTPAPQTSFTPPTPAPQTSFTPPAPEQPPLNASTSIPTPGITFLEVPKKPSLPIKTLLIVGGGALFLIALGYYLGFLFDL